MLIIAPYFNWFYTGFSKISKSEIKIFKCNKFSCFNVFLTIFFR